MSWHLFDVVGVELEYMIVDQNSLNVVPFADRLIHDATGSFVSDVDRGTVAWSNELVNHVVELKTNGPAKNLAGLHEAFYENVIEINARLAQWDAMLLSGGAHPWMNPLIETRLWPHEYNEIYALYDRIFGCKGHGWSNLQSTHMNLPFGNDEEFERLHTAIRFLMPLIPGLSASTPFLDGKETSFSDARLVHYEQNQKRFPVIAGDIIPEYVVSKADYEKRILSPIADQIRPFDEEGILDRHFLNSRGAIARFDRGSIEIRVVDLQESPVADLTTVALILAALKMLVNLPDPKFQELRQADAAMLKDIYDSAVCLGGAARVSDAYFCKMMEFPSFESQTVGGLWLALWPKLESLVESELRQSTFQRLTLGTLSSRLLASYGAEHNLKTIYSNLAKALRCNTFFV